MQHIKQVLTAVMLLMGGMAWAQTNGQFVIKTTVSEQVHYLSHAGNALGDAITFSPNVLWTSDNTYTQGGTNRNYYFMEGNTPHFLAAPEFSVGGALALSSSLPPGNQLSTPEAQYYFYKWDGGLGRGVQYYGDCANNPASCVECGHVWGDDQCWDVYWVAYVDATWKLSGKYYDLDDVPSGGGRYYPVTITEHLNDTTTLSGGLSALTDFEMEYQASPLTTHQVIPTIADYQYTVRPAYTTYVFDGGTHNYYDAGSGAADQGESTPASVNSSVNQVADATYAWTLSGPGATYLTIDNATSANPTITYSTQNETGHKTATLTLTVTYRDGSKQSTSANILVKTPCQNPPVQDENATVTFVGATVSWDPTATSYLVSWRVYDPDNSSSWNSHEVGDVTSYTITGLEYETKYEYKVKATSCSTAEPAGPYPTFTTLAEPGLMVTGAIFGGGRMADVGGMTEVVVVNCDSIGAIFGGNDIAGTVLDTISANHTAGYAGANITLGVDSGNPYDYHTTYGTTPNDGKIRVSSVYGGGNGYYAYNGSSFVPATSSYTSETVAVGSSVKAMTQFHQVGDVVWTNDGATPKTLNFPRITNTAIIATNNLVKVDSIFGGAKNAFLTANSGDGDSIVINGGTVFAVFGGNNWGGGQGYGIHHIEVNGTKTKLVADIANSPTEGYGRDFGIRYLFGGGNKVEGSTTDIHIKGGQSDEVFAGGNAADVYKANVTVECSLGDDEGDHLTFGDTYTNAINHESYTSGTIGENTVYTNYGWDGLSGIYNVRTLYGGNNEAEMQRVPNVTLTSGSVGTVYGGGNAGDMMGSASTTINGNTVLYGTHVVLNSNRILTDYIYGGCRMSDVLNSTWVELKKGHVGTVYGGCNISGDVGSTRFYDPYPSGETYPQNLEEQRVKGATYVQTGDGGSDTDLIVYKDLFAGSNGYYHCSSDGIHYNEDELFGYPETLYAGMDIPTHNETNVVVTTGTTVKGNVYAGGNLAPVGFDDGTGFARGYPELVGMATVIMTGGRVEKDVYGGGNMASIFGRNEVKVSGGTIVKGLYGGNDRAGQVAEKTQRKLPTGYGYTVASDTTTSLTTEGVMTFVGVSGNARIGTVYGGGNGAYTYGEGGIPYCGLTPSHPIQPFTFVDININGGASGGKIGTVYGGGNGVTVRGGAIVFMNIVEPNPAEDYSNVDTIFGGNNIGDLEIVPDIRLLHGQVGTVYGGCNQGAMMATNSGTNINLKTIGGYENIGSYVRLYNTYVASADSTHTVTAKVKEAVYGGCRMNGVTHNSLVLAEGGNFLNVPLYGGSDISGTVSGFSRVAVTGGTVGNVYGGGNGGYYYKEATNAYGTYYEVYRDDTETVQVADSVPNAPICANSGVDVTGGQVGTSGNGNNRNIFGGGYGQLTSTTGDVLVNFNGASAVIYGDVYGGSALGSVNTLDQGYSTTVNILNGTLHGDIYGGGLGQAPVAAQGTPGDSGYTPAVPGIAATVNGKVYVNIGSYDSGTGNYSGNATFDNSDVYGCNNLNGTPMDSVFVNIYKTAHGDDPHTNKYPMTPPEGYSEWTVAALNANATGTNAQTYAIHAVYGGGNQAAYTPDTLANGDPRCSTVHIYGCQENTVQYVYGGGNAADVGYVTSSNDTVHANTRLIVDGGRIHQSFGGGNGAGDGNPGANIYGVAKSEIYAGLIDEVYGGANMRGSVDAIDLLMSHSTVCGDHPDEVYGAVFGCANAADYNRSVTTTIECNVGTIGELYGGSNQASIGTQGQNNADVTLNLYGGNHTQVFAGSKGIADDPSTPEDESVVANIYGNVTLNLYGGTVGDAFGGSDANGNIAGTITVNVLDHEGTCGLDLTNVYGGSNLTPYAPTTAAGQLHSPVVNVMHINNEDNGVQKGIRGNVYGGGNEAAVTGNPIVNIGYDAVTMAGLIPSTFPITTIPTDNFLAYVTGNVFGGGNLAAVTGTDTVNIRRSNSYVNNVFGGGNEAGTTNTVVNVYDGTVHTDVYGGCNTSGTVTGDIKVNLLGGTVARDVFGGGMGNSTATQGNILVTVDGGTVTRDVYGGSALGQVNNETTDLTKVWLKSGSITGNLYGGGMGEDGQDTYGQVNGQVEVLVNGGTVTDVFGCNNLWGMPKSSVKVDIDGNMTINGNVYGGGNQATYSTASNNYPEVNILNGTLTHDVFGGGLGNAEDPTKGVVTGNPQVTINGANVSVTGNIYGCGSLAPTVGNALVTLTNGATTNIFGGGKAANVTGNPTVNVEGGTVSTGVYGGCHNSGIVDGNITVNIRGDNVSQTTIGTLTALQDGTTANIHGGGYGAGTSTTGNVTVTFGTADASSEHCEYPMLYGDMYGGSALGTINNDASDVTTVTVLNGSVKPAMLGNTQYGGNIYGGGLGDLTHAATVNGEVHVNIGDTLTSIDERIGKASLRGCNVFGCNNKNGSPQQDVFVHVFQTNHIASDVVEELDGDFAIKTVYGGGNMADYAPTDNPNQSYSLKTHNYIHACDNTVGTVYGGGRAAAADGVETNVDGGRFEYIFGGGNGQIDPANIGWGGIELTVCSGHVGYKYGGCDMGGNVLGVQHDNPCDDGPCNEPLVIGYFFFGANKSTIIGGLMDTIRCSDPPMSYKNVYAGSRLAVIYGDIYMLVRGGEITNLFGGSQGSIDRPGHVRRYPHLDNPDEMALVPSDAYNDMVTYLTVNPTLQGQGGNIYMRIEGGTLCNVYCGNQLYGTVDGDIIVVVDDQEETACPLVIDTLYGGNEKAIYEPGNGQTRISPQVYLKNGKINYDVYAGSFGDRLSLIENAGRVHSNPYVMIGSNDNDDHAIVGRNVYGGGSKADVVGNTKVVIRGNATIGDMADGGDVYGGSREGDVNGNTDVEIEPTSIIQEIVIPTVPPPALHTITFSDNSASGTEYGTIYVTNSYGNELTSGAQVAQGSVLHVRIVVNSSPDYEFYGWGVTGASVVQPFEFSTAVIIGSGDANLTANFTTSGTNNLTLTLTPNIVGAGSFKVNGAAYTGPVLIPQGFPVTVQALHAENYVFGGWEGLSGLTITNGTTSTSTVTFNMGTSDVDLRANFVPTHTLTLIASPEGACTFTVNDDPYIGTLTIAEGITVDIVATPAAGHEGDSILWTSDNGGTIGSETSLTTTFTMGNSNTNVTATFTAPTPP